MRLELFFTCTIKWLAMGMLLLLLAHLSACGGGGGGGGDGASRQDYIAQGFCIPLAEGVIGQPGPPAWWDGSTGPMNDPRWQGALSYGHSNDDAQMRMLQYVDGTQKYLVLSWEVKADSGPATSSNDFLYVGFWDPGNNRGNIIRITRTGSVSVTDGIFGTDFNAITYYRDDTTSGSWWLMPTVPPAPDWLQNDARLDATCIAGPPPICDRWSIRMRIPINTNASVSNPASGIPLADVFRMWYQLLVEKNGSVIVRYKWPSTADNVLDIPVLTFPDPMLNDQWVDIDTTPSATSCPGDIDIRSDDVFLDNGSDILSTTNPNVFHIQPVNTSSVPVDGNIVRARLRISNWGATLYESPEWLDINPSAPSCASATGSADPVAPGDRFDLTCTWTLTPEQQCQYRPDLYNTCVPMPGVLNDFQCILAELSSTTGVLFSHASTCGLVRIQ